MSHAQNLAFLDDLCTAYLLPPTPSPSPSPPSLTDVSLPPPASPLSPSPSSHFDASAALAQSRALARARALFLSGALPDAVAFAASLSPAALSCPRFQLSLRLHTLRELVTAAAAGAAPDYAAALRYARVDLAPFAQEAFLEAYQIFQEALCAMFVFPPGEEELERSRSAIADRAVATIRARLGARGTRLAFLLRYLVVIYLGRGARFAPAALEKSDPDVAAVIADIAAAEDESGCGSGAPDGSVEAGNDGGNRGDASGSSAERNNEVAAAGDTVESRDAYYHSYSFRGEAPVTTEAQSHPWALDPRPIPHESPSRDFAAADLLSLSDRLPLSQEECIDSMRYASGDVAAALLLELARVRLNRPAVEVLVRQYCRVRGLVSRGDSVDVEKVGDGECGRNGDGDGPREEDSEASLRSAQMRRLRKLALSGSATELVQLATQIEPTLLRSSPTLHFRVAQASLMEQLNAGNFVGALNILRSKLGPMADQHPDLLPALRETTVLLAFPEASPSQAAREPGTEDDLELDSKEANGGQGCSEASNGSSPSATPATLAVGDIHSIRKSVSERSSASSLAAPIFRAVSLLHGPPLLVRVLNVLLETHSNWLQGSGMTSDQFGELLGLHELRLSEDFEGEHGFCTGSGRGSGTGFAAGSGAGPGEGELGADREGRGGSGSQGVIEGNQPSALKINTLREFLNVSRAEALEILSRYPASLDIQAVIESHMGG